MEQPLAYLGSAADALLSDTVATLGILGTVATTGGVFIVTNGAAFAAGSTLYEIDTATPTSQWEQIQATYVVGTKTFTIATGAGNRSKNGTNLVAHAGTPTITQVGGNLTGTFAQDVAIGDTVFVICTYYHQAGANGTMVDSVGNVYGTLGAPDKTAPNTNVDMRVVIFRSKVTVGIVGGATTYTWTSPSPAASKKTMASYSFRGIDATLDASNSTSGQTSAGNRNIGLAVTPTHQFNLTLVASAMAHDSTELWGQDDQPLTAFGTSGQPGNLNQMVVPAFRFAYDPAKPAVSVSPNIFDTSVYWAAAGVSYKVTTDPTETLDFFSKIADAANWGSAGAYQPGAAAAKLILPFDEDNKAPGATAFDLSGNGFNGVYVGGALATGSPLPDATGAKFNGVNQYVEVASPVGNPFSINPAGGVGPGLTLITLVRLDSWGWVSDRSVNSIGTITSAALVEGAGSLTYSGGSSIPNVANNYVSLIDPQGKPLYLTYSVAAAGAMTITAWHGPNAGSGIAIPAGTTIGAADSYGHYEGKGQTSGVDQEYALRVYEQSDANTPGTLSATSYLNERGWVPAVAGAGFAANHGPRMSTYGFSQSGGEGAGSFTQTIIGDGQTAGLTWRLMIGSYDGGDLTTLGPGGLPDKGIREWLNGLWALAPNDSSTLYASNVDAPVNPAASNNYKILPQAAAAPLRFAAQAVTASKHPVPVSLAGGIVLPFVISDQQAYRVQLATLNNPPELSERQRMTMGMGI